MRNVRQNLMFAFAKNAIGILIAAGVLCPTFGILLSPMVAALAMSLSSVSVIVNALRLRSLQFVPRVPGHAFSPTVCAAAIVYEGSDIRHPVS
jgi:hypothetical protein